MNKPRKKKATITRSLFNYEIENCVLNGINLINQTYALMFNELYAQVGYQESHFYVQKKKRVSGNVTVLQINFIAEDHDA